MRRFYSLLACSALAAFSAPAFAEDYVLMKVNSTNVTASELKSALESQYPKGQAPTLESLQPEMRETLLRSMMVQHLLLAEVEKSGFEKTESAQNAKKTAMLRAYIGEKASDVTDADLKSSYDDMVAKMRDEKEVHARHILVGSEQEAKDIKKKLKEGKSFEEIAKEYSKDPGSAANGGDLGYFTKDKMVKEFADAAFALKKGGISDPVKSPFGWHVIKQEDARKITPPTFNEVRESLRQQLQAKKVDDYMKDLVKKADVKVFDEKGKEVKFAKLPPEATKKK